MSKLQIVKNKIIPKSDLDALKSVWNLKDQKVVFTNGCFDLIHRGHIEYLAMAADKADLLVIGLNTDDSVKRLKGEGRPVQDQEARAIVLSAIHFVDYVIFFEEDTPAELIQAVEPDVLVKGADYDNEDIAGYDFVTSNGGVVETIPLSPGYSTSSIIEKLLITRND